MHDIKKFEPLWGSWSVTEKLGEGSFGKVYKIERTEFNNTYTAALKYIRVPQSQSEVKSIMADGMSIESVETYFESVVEDIVSEFVLMSKLKGNSHIVSYEDHKVVKDKENVGWDIFIRMELLTSLLDYIQNNNISKRDVIKLGIDMCKALELCQKFNIIHRDIKPENIFVSESGNFKLGDFGIARQVEKTVAGLSKKGTFTYIAPEVYKGEPYGSTVDIYSLGIVMYRLLNNNRVPFMPPYPNAISHADRELALIRRMKGEKIEKPVNADGRLAEIVLKACSYNPEDRYNSPLLMRMELEAILYDDAEKRIIYPYGDKAEQHSVKYVKTEEDSTASLYSAQYGIENDETQLMTVKSFNEKITAAKENKPENKKKIAGKEKNKSNTNQYAESKRFKETLHNSRKILLYALPVIVIIVILAVAVPKLVSYVNEKRAEEAELKRIEAMNEAASEAYKEIENSNAMYPYCLYDINSDGINELVIGNDGRTGGVVDVYGYIDESAVLIGTVQTYGDAFELRYIFKNDNGLGLVLKDIGRTEYGYWSLEDNNKLQYHLLANLLESDGNITYSVEGVSVTKEEYEEYIRNLAKDKIDDYVPVRFTTSTTTETTTEFTTEAPTQAQTYTSSSSGSYSSGSNSSGSSYSSNRNSGSSNSSSSNYSSGSSNSSSSNYSSGSSNSSNRNSSSNYSSDSYSGGSDSSSSSSGSSGSSSSGSDSSNSSGSSDSSSGNDKAAPELFIGF